MTPRKYDLLALVGAGLLLTLTACGGGTPDPDPQPTASCGNAKVEEGEQCDDGNLNDNDACKNNCTATVVLCGNGAMDSGEECDDGNKTDGDNCSASCKLPLARCGNGTVDPGEACDDGNRAGGDGCEVSCQKTQLDIENGVGASQTPPASGTCTVTAGDANKLFTGYVLMDGRIIKGGQVLVDAAGIIQCADADCTGAAGAATATQVVCPEGVISPGLINPHDHITYQKAPGVTPFTEERYEHRSDWRIGGTEHAGHTKLPNGGTAGAELIRWAELRHLISGTTTLAGAGGQAKLVRNVDVNNATIQEGLGEGVVDSDTFPLGDVDGTEKITGCNYSTSATKASELPPLAAYLPHVGEGIEASSFNEFSCVMDAAAGGQALFGPRTAVIHGIGLTAREIARFADTGTGLIWSPRSNIALYGDTAMVRAYKQLGVEIALGTDWLQSGSMNELRELQCADYLNSTRFDKAFTDEELWRMVTANAADLTDIQEKVGRIAKGKVADLAIFTLRAHAAKPHRAVITANPQDVVLTLRGGKAMFGDAALVAGLNTETCDTLDVCGTGKRVCVAETGKTLAQMTTEAGAAYPLFSCDPAPASEPTCVPERSSTNASWPASVNGSTAYSGVASDSDKDADGIADTADNCPAVFNPVRPMDNGQQLDTDGDGTGDVCDLCPLNANATSCASRNPYDEDSDGISNGVDNCAGVANKDQADTDGDGLGDACELPPVTAVSIYELKEKTATGTYARDGQILALEDVLVTALHPDGFFASAYKDGAYPAGKGVDDSGIYVFLNAAPTVKVGDRVSFTSEVDVYFELIELKNIKDLKTLSEGSALPPFERVAPADIRRTKANATAPVVKGPRADALTGVLVELDRNVFVTSNTIGNGEFVVDVAAGTDAATAGVRVDDALFKYTLPGVGTEFTRLRGVLFFSFDNTKLEPRSADDMVVRFVAPSVASLTPATSYVRVGQTGKTLTVTLSNPYDQAVTVNLTSSAPADLAVPATVTVPALATSAEIPLTIVNANAAVTISAATSVGSAATATVEVLAADAPARIVSLSPSTALTLTAGAAQAFTVTVDAPVAAETTIPVVVTAQTAGQPFGTAGDVVIAAGQSTGTFTFTAAADGDNTGSVSVSHGGATRSTDITVIPATSAPGKLVINEVDYDQTIANDTMEFVEIRNSGSTPVSLSGVVLVFINGSSTSLTEYLRVDLSSQGSLAGGAYLVVGTAGVTVPSGVAKIEQSPGSAGFFQNGAPDALGLFDTTTNTLIDALSYEGNVTAGTINGVTGTFNFREGSGDAATLIDPGNVDGSLMRSADSVDTNDNVADFKFSTTATPGAANVFTAPPPPAPAP